MHLSSKLIFQILSQLGTIGIAVSAIKLSAIILYKMRMMDPRERRKKQEPPKRQPIVYWYMFWASTFFLLVNPIVQGSEVLDESGRKYTTIDIANQATWFGFPSFHLEEPLYGQVIFGNIPFILPQSTEGVIQTQHHLLPDLPNEVSIPVNLDDVLNVFLLINGGYVKKVMEGTEVGYIELAFDGSDSIKRPVIAGRCLREGWAFVEADNADVVTEIKGDSNCTNVYGEFQTRNNENVHAFIDLMKIEIPTSYRGRRLETITIYDTSNEKLGLMDPSMIIIALTVEVSALQN